MFMGIEDEYNFEQYLVVELSKLKGRELIL